MDVDVWQTMEEEDVFSPGVGTDNMVQNGQQTYGQHATVEKILLSDNLPLYPRPKPLFKVTVTQKYIAWEPTEGPRPPSRRKNSLKGKRSSSRLSLGSDSDSSEAWQTVVSTGGIFLSIADIVGCDCMKGKVKSDKNAYLTIYAYPHKQRATSKKTIRKRETLTLTFERAETYELNSLEASKWSGVLQCLANRVNISNVQDLSLVQAPEHKKILILINPASGSFKAVSLFKQRIVPILAEGRLKYEMQITEHAGHAGEMMLNLDTSRWRGVVLVSGDGLIFEVVNGLMSRADWREAIKLPIGCLPCGSGNALSCSISYAAEEPYMSNHVMHATFGLVKHKLQPLDLIAIDTCKGKRIYSFLSCCWGLFSDVDIESEKFRSLGEARFTIGAVSRILGLRKYRGKVSFLPVDEYVPRAPRKKSMRRSQSLQAPTTTSEAPQVSRSVSLIADTQTVTPTAHNPIVDVDEQDGEEEPECTDNTTGLVRVTDGENGTQPMSEPNHDASNARPQHSDAPQTIVPPLGSPVPEHWVTLDGEFITVAGIYLTHLAKDLIPSPDSCLDDGVIYLVIVHSGIGRMKLISLMSVIEKGGKIADPNVELIKVKAFRMEPAEGESESGIMTVDGERVDYGPIQGCVLPSLATVMVPDKGYFASHK